jgi:hypothetical protein
LVSTPHHHKGIRFEHKSVVMLANEHLDYFSCALRRQTMLGKRRKILTVKVFVVFVFFAFATAGFAARIIPIGTVSIIEDDKVIGEFSQEAPLPEGVLLRCEGNCAVKLDDVYVAVEPKTVFSVSLMANRHYVLVQKGAVYFSINESSRPLHFDTPAGNATTGDLSMTEGELIRGYVRVVGNETEIGVMSGGSMMLEIGSEEFAVASGKKITLALVYLEKTAPAASGASGAIDVSEHPDHGDPGGGEPGGGDPGGGEPGGGDPGGGDPGGGDPGGGEPGGGDPGGGDPGGGDGDDGDDGGKGGDKGGGKGGDKGGGKGGDKGGGKGGDKKKK